MGKRSTFKRRERDFYPTPRSAVMPLAQHLPKYGTYIEPCVGEWHLVDALSFLVPTMECVGAHDIDRRDIIADAAFQSYDRTDLFITNPPWPQRGGEPTVSIALNLSNQAPTWLLLSADFAHNRYFSKLADRCVKIVSVGRVSWMQNGTAGKDNCAWYLFDARHDGPTEFVARAST